MHKFHVTNNVHVFTCCWTLPWFKTYILVAREMVDSRWATTRTVLSFLAISIAACTHHIVAITGHFFANKIWNFMEEKPALAVHIEHQEPMLLRPILECCSKSRIAINVQKYSRREIWSQFQSCFRNIIAGGQCTVITTNLFKLIILKPTTKIHLGFVTIARASAMRCFWPPLNWVPLSPQVVLYPFGRLVTNSSARAYRHAVTTSSNEAFA